MISYAVDKQRWWKMSIFEQMGNIGAEVGRAMAAKRRGDKNSMQNAFYRGLDLLDATASVWAAKKSHRTKEILRAREQFAEAIMSESYDNKLESYFMQFAIVARQFK